MPITHLKLGESRQGILRPFTLCQHSLRNNPPTAKPFQTLPRRTTGDQGVKDSAPPPSKAKAFGPRLPKGVGEQALPELRSLLLSPSDPQNAARAAHGSPREPGLGLKLLANGTEQTFGPGSDSFSVAIGGHLEVNQTPFYGQATSPWRQEQGVSGLRGTPGGNASPPLPGAEAVF